MGRPKRLYPLGKYRLRIRGPIDTSKAYLVELEYTWNRQIVRKGMNIFVKVGDWNEKLNKGRGGVKRAMDQKLIVLMPCSLAGLIR